MDEVIRPTTTSHRFRPQLMPNDVVAIEDMPDSEWYVSKKLDGIRCIFMDGKMLSRSLKPIPNARLHEEKFDHIKRMSEENTLIYDGELYDHDITFQEISGIIRSHDKEPSPGLKFHCFDCLDPGMPDEPLKDRLRLIPDDIKDMVKVEQREASKKDFPDLMAQALEERYEGLIIRNPTSKYKFGRITSKSGDGYKLKDYATYDAKIHGFVQATEYREGSEKKINELGYSETSRKKDDRVPIPKVAAFLVMYDGVEQKVTYAATDEQKEWAWENREGLMGKMIEFKGLKTGMKERLRHPVFLRFREDKDA